MTEEEGLVVLASIADAGVKKINFVGGEPMLHPHLKAWIIEAKRLGMTTSIVSNGTRMSRAWLEEMKPHLDWLGLSIDASNDALHAIMGRGRRGEIKQGTSRHLERCERVLADAKAIGYGIKLNTVVSSVNIDDDMSAFIRRVEPTRWKIFQALPIAGKTTVKSNPWRYAPPILRPMSHDTRPPSPTHPTSTWWQKTTTP